LLKFFAPTLSAFPLYFFPFFSYFWFQLHVFRFHRLEHGPGFCPAEQKSGSDSVNKFHFWMYWNMAAVVSIPR
jgi:hypothetical protein